MASLVATDVPGRLVGSDIHGFHTLKDLDIGNILDEARSRWLRPNEIHAILCNHKYFTIFVKPVNLPKSGTIVLFDRKMLRNFRKDGHNWKKKKDGKTVKEAHEHLKVRVSPFFVGTEERIHVYYAHGQDNQTFVRRCYWLLDKALEHIVLVHYRETQEMHSSPVTPMNSNSSSVSDPSTPWLPAEEFDSGAGNAYSAGEKELIDPGMFPVKDHQLRLHEINTLEWDDLVAGDTNNLTTFQGDVSSCLDNQNQISVNGSSIYQNTLSASNLSEDVASINQIIDPYVNSGTTYSSTADGTYSQTANLLINSNTHSADRQSVAHNSTLSNLINDGLQSQDSFGRWINDVMAKSADSLDDHLLQPLISSGDGLSTSPDHSFVITDVSPSWGFSDETTKVLVTGYFHEQFLHLGNSDLVCVCGNDFVPTEVVQSGVYRCYLPPHSPGLVNLCLSLDGHKPLSQVLNFEYRRPAQHDIVVSRDENSKWEHFHLQMRLACLLLSTSKSLNLLSSKISPSNLKEAKKFASRTSTIFGSWSVLFKSIDENRVSLAQAKEDMFEITLKNILKEWLFERVAEGCKATEYDAEGLGVIHLCARLGYTWAIYLYSWSGLSLDFRDKHGWTALHWAAYYGRERMVAVLLSAGAKPNLVTDPTTENPGGCTPADLAEGRGYEGLAAYLSEKALVSHFKDMSIAGNVCGTLQTTSVENIQAENLSEEELYLKDALAAYRTAADAAGRIQAAFREQSLKLRAKAVEISNPEDEARNIVAAMKIQHAFRNYEVKKKMAAAVRIQYRFRTWKMRREFLNLRRQTIRIQAAFRGFQVRRQYGKILWSVGVLEKAVLRWRKKRKGFRNLKIEPLESIQVDGQPSDTEEEFFKTSRKQAEERVEKAVVTVQSMFRSKKAQAEYRRMKLAYNEASLEYEGLLSPDTDMGK
ncbi:Calmodulin-binding transcription activator 5 [Linum perenne]